MKSRNRPLRARRRKQEEPKRRAICELFMGSGSGAGEAVVDVGDIGHSLRFRGAQHLNRTITTDATSTYSFWVKRGTLGVISPIIENNIKFNADNTLTAFTLTTSAVFRDPTAWIHIHISNGGLYVDGVSLGAVTTSAITNGRIGYNGTNHFDGYLARFCVVGGSSSAYTNFTYLNTEINKWVTKTQAQVKAVVDAGGTNSFMLDFDDGTSLTTLGYDKSSKGNNWTLNGHSLTLGSTYDWMLDVPGNSYATLSSIDWFGTAAPTFSEGNLTYATNTAVGSSNTNATRLSYPIPNGSGKWYWEVAANAASIANTGFIYLGNTAGSYIWWNYGGQFQVVGSAGTVTIPAISIGDVIQIMVDADSKKIWYGKNGTLYTVSGTPDPVAGTGQAHSYSSEFTPDIQGRTGNSAQNLTVYTGQAPLHASATYYASAKGYFRYAPPTGFKALCQANLPDPAIKNPTQHFRVKLDTGANIKSSTEALFPNNFLEWIKDRANSNNHQLIDTVRGTSAVLQSNTTAAETTYTAPSGSSVGWAWKMGGAAVTNNAGSISSQVSANVEAGQSIVTYNGTGANATVGHGLGAAPELVIVKSREDAIDGLYVYNQTLGATKALFLNLTSAAITSSNYWNDTSPTPSVLTVKGPGVTNRSGDDYVAYCFRSIPGYSKVGSYSGVGATAFIHCGFKVRWLLIKRVDSATDWILIDTARYPFNTDSTPILYPASSSAEYAGGTQDIDVCSLGFTLRDTHTAINASGGTYIFYAVADIAGKYS